MSGRRGMKRKPPLEQIPVAHEVMNFVTNKRGTSARRYAPFIAWDGEGAADRNSPTRQNYVLLGNSTGEFIRNEELQTNDMLRFIIEQGKKHPDAIHVGYAFDYDVNMILRGLAPYELQLLREKGVCYHLNYRIEHVPHKWITITERGANYENDEKDKFTVRISDIFGFFQSSFLKAIRSYIPDHPLMAQVDTVESGKAERNSFTYDRIDYITNYWTVEIALLQALVEELRRLVYDVGLYVTQWHGPGAIANYVYKEHNIRPHKAVTSGQVHEAAKYAYAGGRFEMFRFGRFDGPIYSLDINSAYPAAIAELPSLAEGHWEHVVEPTTVKHFGVYHVRMTRPPAFMRQPAPVFHRDHQHNITFPWFLEGWYWSPEVATMLPMLDKGGLEIIEGWEYVGWETYPFSFVPEMYAERKRLKAAGIGSERALKLALNSLYGKMAQRVGWERSGNAPAWHQLDWAGWVTSRTRARLYTLLAHLQWDETIAVETDGVYTTAHPDAIGYANSKDLGGWEITSYKSLYYLQSGVYFLQDETGEWTSKYRGLDNGTLTPEIAEDFLKSLFPRPTKSNPWPGIVGPTTRFVGYRSALHRADNNMGPMRHHHCRWERTTKEMKIGIGKRAHLPIMCTACKAGATAWEMPHDTVIRSRSFGEPMSTPHPIPWEDQLEKDAVWREIALETEEVYL